MSKPWQDRPDLLPTLGVALASVIWGIYWIPLRHLQSLGLEGIWPTLGTFLLGVAVLGPVAVLRRRQLAAGGLGLMITGLCVGAAFATYATGLLLTPDTGRRRALGQPPSPVHFLPVPAD